MLNNYYFNVLAEDEQRVYKKMLFGFRMKRNIIGVPMVPNENTFLALRLEHPELCSCSIRNAYFEPFDTCTKLLTEYHDSKKVNECTRTMISILTNPMHCSISDEEVVRALHNFLVKNVKYDYKSTISNIYDPDNHSIIGPLLHGKGVCDGIALTFKALLDAKGIDNAVVTGTLLEKGTISASPNHMWNVVSVNGNNYFIDVTQDIGATEKDWDKPSYMYYMLTDEELRKTHVWNDDFNCCSIADNPFDKHKRNFTTFNQIRDYVLQIPKAERLIYFKCTNLSEREVNKAVMKGLEYSMEPYRALTMTVNAGRYYFFKEA